MSSVALANVKLEIKNDVWIKLNKEKKENYIPFSRTVCDEF